jgi:hypothetical protein
MIIGEPLAVCAGLREPHVQAVDFLRALIPHQQRRIIRSEADPEFPGIESPRNFLQTEQAFDFAVRYIYAHDVVDLVGIIFRIDISAIVGPVLESET